jgi:DNA-directed RNA polymerase specialized sigma24 family protein
MLPLPEPPDEVVEQFIRQHPGGAEFQEIAQLLGFSHQRCQIIVRTALKKIYRQLSQRNVWHLDDMI